MVKVALKDVDFEAVRRIASIAVVSLPLVILGACGQNSSSSGDVSGTAEKEATPPPAPSGDEAAPSGDESAAPSGDEATPPATDEGAGSSDDSGSTAPDSSGTE